MVKQRRLIPLVLQLLLARRQNPFWGVLAGTAGLILIVAWIGTRLNASLVMKAALPLYALTLAYAVSACFHAAYRPELQSGLLFVLLLPAIRNVSLYKKYSGSFAYRQAVSVMLGWLIVLFVPGIFGHSLIGIQRYFAVILAALLFALRLIADRRSAVSRGMYIEFAIMMLIGLGVIIYFTTHNPDYAERIASVGSSDFSKHMQILLHTAAPFGSTEVVLSDGTSLASLLTGKPAYAGAAILLLFGYVPFLAAFASIFVLAVIHGQMARTAGNSFARHLLDAAGAWFLVRIAVLLLDLFVLGDAGEALPLTGHLAWVLADVLLVAVSASLYVQSLAESPEQAPELDLDYEAAQSSRRLSYYQSYLRIEDGRLQEELKAFEGIADADLTDEEYDRMEQLQIRREEIADELRETEREHEKLLRRKNPSSADASRKPSKPEDLPLPNIPQARTEESDSLTALPRELIFLSHNHADEAFALALAADLEAAGYRCWYCERDIAPGEPYTGAVMRGLSRAKLCIFLLDEQANASVHIRTEAEVAHEMSLGGLQVLPVYLSDIKLSPELTYSLKIFKKIRIYQLSDPEKRREILAQVWQQLDAPGK
ncbi:MAG: TIR domain-containing protein [Lachnospiraceae bacterium]|nr:TIR domain-containing protein [Lachnospiraceae bacterium]